MILWLFGAIAELVATQWLKDDLLKVNCSKPMSNLLSLMNPILYLLSTICAHPCYFPTPLNFKKVALKIDEVTEEFREDR
jgi:hypothetical protein